MGSDSQEQVSRVPWERPTLRRLEASDAQGGNTTVDDGSCIGGGPEHHSCKRAP